VTQDLKVIPDLRASVDLEVLEVHKAIRVPEDDRVNLEESQRSLEVVERRADLAHQVQWAEPVHLALRDQLVNQATLVREVMTVEQVQQVVKVLQAFVINGERESQDLEVYEETRDRWENREIPAKMAGGAHQVQRAKLVRKVHLAQLVPQVYLVEMESLEEMAHPEKMVLDAVAHQAPMVKWVIKELEALPDLRAHLVDRVTHYLA
jgi:hypothetical protein